MSENPLKQKKVSKFNQFFNNFSTAVVKATGKPISFILSVVLVIVWGLTGPIFNYSSDWQLVINTSTTIITFWMVFVIQHSQNKDVLALHIKLNELVAASKKASNRVVAIEDLTEEELEALTQYYKHLAKLSKEGANLFTERSIDEAEKSHNSKYKE